MDHRRKVLITTFTVILAFSMLLSGCSDPWAGGSGEMATFTINLGGGTERLAWGPNDPPGSFPTFSDLRFEIEFTPTTAGTYEKITVDGPSSGVIQGDIEPGEYNVTLDIYFREGGGIYSYATGSLVDDTGTLIPHVEIVSGPNTVYIKAAQTPEQGTALNPFIVYDQTTLAKVGMGTPGDWGRADRYVLMKDVPLTGSWTPICDVSNQFLGIFDGNGKTINLGSNIITPNPSTGEFHYAGLFDTIGGGTVKNLKLEGSINVTVSGISPTLVVGGLAALVGSGGKVENVYSSVNITARSPHISNVGGIAGIMELGSILNCRSDGTIIANGTGSAQIGGIAGQNHDIVQFCWSEVNITAPNVANSDTGGIVGIVRTGGTLTNCVALNNTISGGDPYGRVFGRDQGGTTINSNFANSAMSNGSGTIPGGSVSDKDGENVTPTQASTETWWIGTIGPTWNIQANKSTANESNPWYWNGSRPVLWFE